MNTHYDYEKNAPVESQFDYEDKSGGWSIVGACSALPGNIAKFTESSFPVVAYLTLEHVYFAHGGSLSNVGNGKIKVLAAVLDQSGELRVAASLPGFIEVV